MPFWTSLDVTADSGKPKGLPARAYPLYTAPGIHHTVKLRYSVDNPGEVRSTAVYPPSWIRVNSVRKVAKATLQFHVGGKNTFWISDASQVHFGSFKGFNQCGYYFREHLYSQINLKAWDREEKQAFSSRLILSSHIARLAMYPIDPGILISLYASAHLPYTTLATGEWMICWPLEDSPVEVRPT